MQHMPIIHSETQDNIILISVFSMLPILNGCISVANVLWFSKTYVNFFNSFLKNHR